MQFTASQISEENQSKTIAFLRFPLTVLVVLMHAKYIGAIALKKGCIDYEICFLYNNVSFIVSDILGAIAVPTFFFLSGFLFFYHVEFSFNIYINKIYSRVKSIFLPYLSWNLLVLFCFWVSEFLPIQMYPSGMKLISDFTLRDFLYSFWNTQLVNPILPSTGPINPQFWYLRDLMVQILLSPLVYFFIIKLKNIFIFFVGGIFILELFPNIEGFGIHSVFFFSWGAYFSINKKSIIITPLYKLRRIIVYIFFIFIIFIISFKEYSWITYLKNINIILGVIVFIIVSAYKLNKKDWRLNTFLSGSSFFIYAFHELVLMFTIKLLSMYWIPSSDSELLISYFLSSFCVITMGLFIDYILKVKCNTLNRILTGNR